MKKLFQNLLLLSLFTVGAIFTLSASYWFRNPQIDDQNNEQKNSRIYDQILIFFLDATGYRYIENKLDEPIFQTITALKNLKSQEPNSTFFAKTLAIPPSTDFTILSLMSGIVQMSNYLDVTFRSRPQYYESSFTKKPIKSALFSSKKADWFKMSAGQFTYVENTHKFNLNHIQLADHSSFQYFQDAYKSKKYDFLVCHFMGYDALGHALQYQSFEKGITLMRLYNRALEWIIQRLENNQLLIVIGDHDQSYRGKHYQCSVESRECEGFMFAYHKGGLFKREHKPDHYEPADISATIHALFGFDTSNQNMGKLLPEFYPANVNQTRLQQDQEMVKDRMIKHMKNQGNQIGQRFIEDVTQLDAAKAQETMQINFRFGKPDKVNYAFGLILFLIAIMISVRKQEQLKRVDYVYIAILVLGQIISSLFYLLILVHEIKQKLKSYLEITKITLLSIILCFPKIITYIPIEVLYVTLLISKYRFLGQCEKQQISLKTFIVYFIIIVSQSLVYIFFSFDRILYDERKYIALSLVANLAIFSFINPKLFNNDKIKILYILILYLIADISVIFQLNPEYNFIQFILLFGMMDLFNGFYNIVLAKLIMTNINPMMIQHSQYQGQTQINRNSFIILVHDFQVGPSLLSIFFGYFGLLLIAQLTQLAGKMKQHLILISQYIFIVYISILLLQFDHEIDKDPANETFLLSKQPIYLMELIILFVSQVFI